MSKKGITITATEIQARKDEWERLVDSAEEKARKQLLKPLCDWILKNCHGIDPKEQK